MFSLIDHHTGRYEVCIKGWSPEKRRIVEGVLGILSVSGPMEVFGSDQKLVGVLVRELPPGYAEDMIVDAVEGVNERLAQRAVSNTLVLHEVA